jgi:hypothetical protein
VTPPTGSPRTAPLFLDVMAVSRLHVYEIDDNGMKKAI